MTLKHLRIFTEIAHCRNMSQAAEQLHFSQPTMSQVVKELEEHYGGALFFRESHGLSLTPRGILLEKQSQQVLNSVDLLEKTMNEASFWQQQVLCHGLDYRKAPLEIRELFSFTKTQQEDFYGFLRSKPEISGAVLLSTCNRMELFLSLPPQENIAPFSLACEFLGKNPEDYEEYILKYEGIHVFTHLSHLASGVKSQIFGEDQIITQVKYAQTMAREFQGSDSYLEVLFRLAITCGKKIRTQLNLAKRDTSLSKQVVSVANSHQLKEFLVIGNGEMARHAGESLLAEGFSVFMSVRAYRHSEVKLPTGVKVVDFEDIYTIMPKVDSIVSATLSPHYTVNFTQFSKLSQYPKILFDLAVPRDIDPKLLDLPEVQLYNVDKLSTLEHTPPQYREEIMVELNKIVAKYEKDYEKWVLYKEKGSISQ